MTSPKRRRPYLVWFKDERVAGTGMSAAQTLRLFIVAVVVAVVVFALGGFYLISVSQKTDATARTAASFARQSRELVDRLKQIQTRNHASRLEDQQRTDRQLRQLACVIVSQVNEDAPGYPSSGRRAVKQFRAFYRCPPYSARGAANPLPHGPMPSTAAPPTRTPAPTGHPSAHAAPAAPSVARTVQAAPSTTPASTVTRTVSPSPTRPSSGAPAPVRSVVCTVLSVVGLCRTETP